MPTRNTFQIQQFSTVEIQKFVFNSSAIRNRITSMPFFPNMPCPKTQLNTKLPRNGRNVMFRAVFDDVMLIESRFDHQLMLNR